MKNEKLLKYLSILSILALNGCGSSNSTPTETVTGQFVDTFVSGLNYTCSTGTTGVTNAEGEYTCNVGDTVDFFLGKYKLGSATASSGLVTPEVLYPNNSVAELNIAQILQTLDSDSTDGIITIPENYSALDAITTTPESSDFDAQITSAIGVTLVTEAAAQAHLNEVEILVRLSGKTFYYADKDVNKVQSIVFNKDLTSFTSTEDAGPTATTLDGNHLNVLNLNESFSTFEGNAVSGTYSITNNILTIVRTSGNNDLNIQLTYLNSVNGALNFDISINGNDTFQTTSYPTEAARDAS
jgi:hypothetical protein